jgi:hypothetical protein
MGDIIVSHQDSSCIDIFESGKHPQGGGLSTPRWPDQNQELAVLDVKVECVDGHFGLAVEAARRGFESH